MQLEIASYSDTGQKRKHNEDMLTIDDKLGLVAVADGMGGCQAGEVASAMAVDAIMQELSPLLKSSPFQGRMDTWMKKFSAKSNGKAIPTSQVAYLEDDDNDPDIHYATTLLKRAIVKANDVIYDISQQKTHYRGMGTTIVAALFSQQFVSIAHVGDSRLYVLRNNELILLTKDHSVIQVLIDLGVYTPEQARHSPKKNLLTRALGVGKTIDVDIQEYVTTPNDIYLLCSDGLNDMLEDRDILETLSAPAKSLDELAKTLVDIANERGGDDNISVILVRPVLTEDKPKPWWQRWLPKLEISAL